MAPLKKIYKRLIKRYGPQGWWPLLEHQGNNPTSSGVLTGYHPGCYEFPKTGRQRYEIILGAILTQNASWTNAEGALFNLKALGALEPQKLMSLKDETLTEAIRSARYFNSKARYLRAISRFFMDLKRGTPSRESLLAVPGVGNETADSILLYAYGQPEFVVDAYTNRMLAHLGLVREGAKYGEVKELFESQLTEDVIVYQEYHALIVEHGKQYYSRKPYGEGDELLAGV